MPPAGLNRGKNTTPNKAYQPFCATPDSHSCCCTLFSQTSQSPPLNPDNKESSYEKIFIWKPKKLVFSPHGASSKICLLYDAYCRPYILDIHHAQRAIMEIRTCLPAYIYSNYGIGAYYLKVTFGCLLFFRFSHYYSFILLIAKTMPVTPKITITASKNISNTVSLTPNTPISTLIDGTNIKKTAIIFSSVFKFFHRFNIATSSFS